MKWLPARAYDNGIYLVFTNPIGMDDDQRIEIRPIFELVRTGTGDDGEVLAEHRATGYLPTFLGEFIVRNLIRQGEPYL